MSVLPHVPQECLSSGPYHKCVQKVWASNFTVVRVFGKLVISLLVWQRKLKFGEKKELASGHGITEPQPVRNRLSLGQGDTCQAWVEI